ncbi:hypothetical protein [Bifidobacterium cuniculi]|uniref:hypothetical protein n=1 Tax=Bifidobacterium cuniculi TaxID=1688 RepID=UPI000554B28B|nr:hypothetical protein [Bifidobacterium cuniculi]
MVETVLLGLVRADGRVDALRLDVVNETPSCFIAFMFRLFRTVRQVNGMSVSDVLAKHDSFGWRVESFAGLTEFMAASASARAFCSYREDGWFTAD